MWVKLFFFRVFGETPTAGEIKHTGHEMNLYKSGLGGSTSVNYARVGVGCEIAPFPGKPRRSLRNWL